MRLMNSQLKLIRKQKQALDDITEVKSAEKKLTNRHKIPQAILSVEPLSSQEMVDLVEDSSEDIEESKHNVERSRNCSSFCRGGEIA